MKVVELFSGIGSQSRALKNIHVKHEMLNTCEWDIHAIIAYDLIHNGNKIHSTVKGLNKKQLLDILKGYNLSPDGKDTMPFSSLRALSEETLRYLYSAIIKTNNLVNITYLKGSQLPDEVDLLTYSFPCQDLSWVGSLHGYNKGIDRKANNRSCLLWEVERILLERRKENLPLPKFLLLENVSALLSGRHRKNFEEWKNVLASLSYYNKVYRLNASDFGLPQNRDRLLMLSIYTENNVSAINKLDDYFLWHNLEQPGYRGRLKIKQLSIDDALKLDYTNNKYYSEALECQPNDTPSRRKIWLDNLQITDTNGHIICEKVATITTKQDRHPNSGNLFVDFHNGKSLFRYLTPRECFVLMGFTERDYECLADSQIMFRKDRVFFSRDKIIRLAGNSIAVKVLESVFKQMIYIDKKIL